MKTQPDKTVANKSQSVAHAVSQTLSGSESVYQFVDNRPEAIAQRKLQEIATNYSSARQHTFVNNNQSASGSVIQRKPKSDALSEDEEAAIQAQLDKLAFQGAIDLLPATDFFKSHAEPNVGKLTFDPVSPNYGLAEQDADDPATNNTVDILFGPLAVADVAILMSTLYHELMHAKQHTEGSKSAAEVGDSDYVYGYAKEMSGYIEAAQEIETHWMEIVDADITGVSENIKFLESRGVALSNYWTTLYNAAKNKSKNSKPAKYMERVKIHVVDAYETLRDKYEIDISSYDKRGL